MISKVAIEEELSFVAFSCALIGATKGYCFVIIVFSKISLWDWAVAVNKSKKRENDTGTSGV